MCWLALNNPRYAAWAGPLPEGITPLEIRAPLAKSLSERARCPHRGERLPNQPCGQGLITCTYDGATVSAAGPCKDAVRCCQTCEYFDGGKAIVVASKEMLIPRKLHRVWVGGNNIPEEYERYWQTWKALHPDWEFYTWGDDDIHLLGPECERLCREARNPAEISDVMRYFIIHQYGGAYVDTDFEAWKNIEPVLVGREFVSSYEPAKTVACAFFAGVAGHPILASCVAELSKTKIDTTRNQVETTGPVFFTRHVRPYIGKRGVYITPVDLFYPFDYGRTGTKEQYPKAYAAHHWAHTWKDDWTTLTVILAGGDVESYDSFGPSDIVTVSATTPIKTSHWLILRAGETLISEGVKKIRETLRWAPNYASNDFAFRDNRGGWFKVFTSNDRGLPITRVDGPPVLIRKDTTVGT